MRNLYSVQFHIATLPDRPSLETCEAVWQSVYSWITEWYKKKQIQVSFEGNTFAISPLDGHTISSAFDTTPDNSARYWSLTWKYPSDQDNNLVWQTSCHLAEFEGQAEFTITLVLLSEEFVVSPIQYKLGRPKIVKTIVENFDCYIDNRKLSTQPQLLDPENIAWFIKNVLTSPQRTRPVVLFSFDSYTDTPSAKPADASEKLIGLAEVYVVNKWAAYKLTDEVSKRLSCYDGAIRIYWPGFEKTSNPIDHPLYLPDTAKLLDYKRSIADRLLLSFASISTSRFASGRTTKQAQTAIQKGHEEARETQRKLAQDAKDYGELLKLADEENCELKVRVEQLELKNQALILQISHQVSTESLRDAGSIIGEPSSIQDDDQELVLSSVIDAVERAENDFKDTLTFHDKSKMSAKDSPYKQPEKVFHAFEAMSEVAKKRRGAKGKSIGPIKDLFQKLGFDYKSKISLTTLGDYGSEYRRLYKGKNRDIHEHLCLGNGRPDVCLRIHFFWDEDDEKWVIGHCGRHLPNTKT